MPRIYGHWNGDVWKAIVHARTYHDVDTYTLKVDHGLGIILKRNNTNILNLETKNFKNLKFSQYFKQHKEFMNTIGVDQLDKIFK